MRILLVEDETNLALPLVEILRRNNYEVDCVHDGKAGLHLALSGIFDLILLDVMLPKLSGFEILKKLRKTDGDTPVILLTARDSVNDRVTGLDLGADDYLPKPFNTDELLARIRSAIRRKKGNTEVEQITCSDVTLYPTMLKMTAHTREVELSERESHLANFFFRNETAIMPVDSIIEGVWDNDEATDETVSRYVGFLRKKLAFLGSGVQILEIKGLGYKLLP